MNTGKQHNQMNTTKNNTNTFYKDYAQHGTFTTNTTLAPSTSAAVVKSYAPGEILIYDHVYIRGGYAWVRYMSNIIMLPWIAWIRNTPDVYRTFRRYIKQH